ncbi:MULTISPECIES: nitroreductase family protein [Cyanophyceae]|uniref:Nitroreductase family protein n=1 Tax=Leptolyngbya subtilissima DQ-A4 TaxID=2933933 RepID=A0ABV0JZ10_9CYAN|nr:nitroreductase family protein [Nodosilinea sp. FACHB-141]MBD2112385.1 nitroreductase family protein [Nodosilinea sp. FACHB-141]
MSINLSKNSVKSAIKNTSEKYILRVAVRSRFLSSLYYTVFSEAFGRENQACIYGKILYQESLNSKDHNSYLLRRNIHRIEKGILMRPRRSIFASDYIEETFQAYKKSLLNNKDCEELGWAHDVLSEYFSITGTEVNIDKCRQEFLKLESLKVINPPKIPYKRGNLDQFSVDYKALLDLSIQRRSVRWYLQKPVPRDLIDQAITVAALAPSACNRQPFEFRVFDDPDLVRQISSIPMGTKGFHENFPAVIVVVGKLRAYFSERDRHIIYIDASLASMALMYAFETLGLSSCPINWPDIESKEEQMADLLNLQLDERPVMLISLGYPDPTGMIAYSQKKSLSQIRKFN